MTLGEVVGGGEAKVLQLIKMNKFRLHCAVINYIDWGRVLGFCVILIVLCI